MSNTVEISVVVPVYNEAENVPILIKEISEALSQHNYEMIFVCLLYTSPSPRDKRQSRMPSSA